MKTHKTTMKASGVIFLVSFFLFGCVQSNTAGNMSDMQGTGTEMTEPAMSDSMEPMKTEMGGMDDRKMDSMQEMNEEKMDAPMDTMQEMNEEKMDTPMDTMKEDTMKKDTRKGDMKEEKDAM